jgi:hypothetical protein
MDSRAALNRLPVIAVGIWYVRAQKLLAIVRSIAARVRLRRHLHRLQSVITMVCVKPVRIATTVEMIVRVVPAANLLSVTVAGMEFSNQQRETAQFATEIFNAKSLRR